MWDASDLKSKTKGDAYEKEFITYHMGVQVSYCLGTQETPQGNLWEASPGNRNNLTSFMRVKGVEVLEGKACIDHIHICLSIPPKYSVSTIVGYLKGKSAMIVFEKYSRLKKKFRGHHFWARSYYVSIVGLDEAKVRKYVQEQDVNESVEDRYDTDLSNPF
jgi:putative transposase